MNANETVTALESTDLMEIEGGLSLAQSDDYCGTVVPRPRPWQLVNRLDLVAQVKVAQGSLVIGL
jgi:hypothetical protein